MKNQTKEKLPTCEICKLKFKNGVALGGHASKAHPGSSLKYNYKLKVRAARDGEREFLKKAKEWFIEHYNLDPKATQSRGRITKIKVMLMRGKTPQVTDFDQKRRTL